MPKRMPRAELTIDVPLVATLLEAQHPDLAALPLTVLANGWDNVLVRVGDELLARLPRRVAAAQLVQHEQAWLPRLAPYLSLAVPTPVRVGRPSAGYPWHWSITAYLPGEVAATATGLDTRHAAEALGRFLGELHLPAPAEAPVNQVRGVPLARRAESFTESLPHATHSVDGHTARELWARAVCAEPWPGPPVWLHGDLHPGNILADRGRVSAVIDFGDITSGDPATDLSVAWMLLPEQDREVFWAAYADRAGHRVDEALVLRAAGWALALGAVFVAHSADNPLIRRIGARTLGELVG